MNVETSALVGRGMLIVKLPQHENAFDDYFELYRFMMLNVDA